MLRRLLWWLVILPGIPFVLISIGMLLYANWPSSPGPWHMTSLNPQAQQLTLMTHGMGDNAESWATDLAELLRTRVSDTHSVAAVDWRVGAKSMLRCSRNASVIGERLASEVLHQAPQLQQVHFIAHSAGSFMAYAFCREIKRRKPDMQVQTTYLDPNGIYRGLDWGYGTRNFGNCADRSRAYLHIGDGVPGSEEALEHAPSLDITALKPADMDNGHLWPVHYYLQQIRQQPPAYSAP